MPNDHNIRPRPPRWKGERDEDGIPILPARRVVVERSETDSLIVACPYCSETHWHGAAGKTFGGGDGHRLSHCMDQPPNDGYMLQEIAEPSEEVA